jgi:hypothetical protein
LPWPDKPRTRSPRGGTPIPWPPRTHLPPTEPRTHAREPTADAALAATHGDGPELRRVPHRDALSRPAPHLAVTPTLTVVCALHVHAAAAPTPARSRTGMGCQHHRRAAIAAPAPVPTSPRRPSPPLVHFPSSQQPQGSLVRLSCGDQMRRRRPRRRQGRVVPPFPLGTFRRTPWATSKTAGGLLCTTRGTTHRCGRSRSARIRCGPPLISRPHTGPHGSQPHRPPPDPVRLASSRPRRSAGRRDPGRTRDPGIPCGWPC